MRVSVHRSSRAWQLPVVLVAAVGLLVTGCSGSSSPTSTGTSSKPSSSGSTNAILRLGTPATIASLNPFTTSNTLAQDSFDAMYPFLVQYNLSTDEIEPEFSTSWTTSSDGLTWTFQTRPGAKWSDGTPLTAADVAWTLSTVIKFQKGPTAQLAGDVINMTSATATSPTTLVLKYSHPVADVLSSLAQVAILPQHIWQQYTTGNASALRKFSNLPTGGASVVGGGPFILTKYTQNQIVLFKRNPSWYGPKPKIAGFGYEYFANNDAEVEALKSGQIDAALGNPAISVTATGSLKSAGFNIVNVHATGYHDIIINTVPTMVAHRELLNPKVREAMEYATDRNGINKVAYLGYAQPGSSIVPPASGSWYNPAVKGLPYDIAKANQLLDQAGYKMGSGGIRIGANGKQMSYPFLVSTDNGGEGTRAAAIMATDYKKIGIKLDIQVVNDTTLNNDLYGNHYRNFAMAMWGWDAYIDPNFILSIVTCGQRGAESDSGYCNPAYDALFKQQAATTNEAARKAIVYKMQQIEFNARPYIILEYVNVLEAWSKKWCDIHTSPDGFATFFSKDPIEQIQPCTS